MALYNNADPKLRCRKPCPRFDPDFGGRHLTEKFYSQYEYVSPDGKSVRVKRKVYYSLPEEEKKFIPITSNQTYGWLENLKHLTHEIKYETQITSDVSERAAYFSKKIDEFKLREPRNTYYAPVTETQIYGWIENKECSRIIDPELQHGKKFDEELRILMQIAYEAKQLRSLELKRY
ncbi:uncharacterized protein LOC119681851 [Teleopsis dalmanni]|uniref:uncharacterized protein LOC119681851 n=1 Tax=Teleopsis dalmanni TaxID=139649 RepID=UPI0018CE5DB4|nr:uncharacterized protein LOC119681851 [Teleopsis dalmanni]